MWAAWEDGLTQEVAAPPYSTPGQFPLTLKGSGLMIGSPFWTVVYDVDLLIFISFTCLVISRVYDGLIPSI